MASAYAQLDNIDLMLITGGVIGIVTIIAFGIFTLNKFMED